MEPSSRGSRTGHDVVAAVNTGTVSRFRGTTGRRIFQETHHIPDFPFWESAESVLLNRIDATSESSSIHSNNNNVVPYLRPIVLAGENSAVLISVTTGRILASAIFPQPSVSRPRLIDWNGDGTTDLLVVTTDAVWGYQIVVRAGTTVFVRLIIGLLLLGLMLSLLRNNFGPHPGKRSTDA